MRCLNMKRKNLLFVSFLLLSVSLNTSSGEFIGELKFKPEGKYKFVLLNDFGFKDSKGYIWTTKKGYSTDGASIPRPLWSIIGDPYGGGYIKSAVIHDQACDNRKRSWQDTHRVFYEAMAAEGVNPTMAYIMYAAVYRFGPRWELKKIEVKKSLSPRFEMINTACITCSSVETVAIQESKSTNLITSEIVDIPIQEEITQEKLDIIKSEVAKLEAKGPVSLHDLENIQTEKNPFEGILFNIPIYEKD